MASKSSKFSKTSPPKSTGDFIILPLTLPALPGLPPQYSSTTHYLYIKPHTPNTHQDTLGPSEYPSNALFITNVPIDASESSIRDLFSTQLGGAMVESVDFDTSVPERRIVKRFRRDTPAARSAAKANATVVIETATQVKKGKKRKRNFNLADDEARLAEGVLEDEENALPQIWPISLRRSGGSAVVFFIDAKSCLGAMKSVKKTVKYGNIITWKGGNSCGVERYKTYLTLLHPSHPSLQTTINSYLATYTTLESARSRSRNLAHSTPDTDGFVTVTRGARSAPARVEEAEKKKAELAERRKGLVGGGFYRFQNREKRKEEEGRLRKRFERDRERVMEMRERRGKMRVEK